MPKQNCSFELLPEMFSRQSCVCCSDPSTVPSPIPIHSSSQWWFCFHVCRVGFCTCCCPLLLAAGHADFMSNPLLGFGSSSVLVSLNSCDVMLLLMMMMLLVYTCCLSASFASVSLSPQPTPLLLPYVFDPIFLVLAE